MENENENLSDKIDDINSQLVKANDFNEDAALELDLIYNFLSQNQNLFKNQNGGMPNLDSFFDKNGYIPVKVLNPCCCSHDEETSINWPKLPTLPKFAPIEVPVPKPATVTVPDQKPVVVPQTPPVEVPVPAEVPPVVVPEPPKPIEPPIPETAPPVLPKPDSKPDVIPFPDKPKAPEVPDATPGVNNPPPIPVLPPANEPSAPVPEEAPAVAAKESPFLTDTTGIVDPGLPADSDFKIMLGIGAAAIGASLAAAGLAALSALNYGAYALGAGGLLVAIPANADELPPDAPKPQSYKDNSQKGFKSKHLSKVSYSARDSAVTDEITLKADEIKFISDVIRFKNTGIFETPNSSSYTTQNVNYTPPPENPKTDNTTTGNIASSHESRLNSNPPSEEPMTSKPKDNTVVPVSMGLNGITDMGSSMYSMASPIGRILRDLSSKIFMTAKVPPPKVMSPDPTQSQPVMFNSETTGYPTSGPDKPMAAMTSFEQSIFDKSGMFA
jgi:hypothetical protein